MVVQKNFLLTLYILKIMKTLSFEQMEVVNGGADKDGCDYIEEAAAVVGVVGIFTWINPIFGAVYTIVTSPIVIAGAMCTFFG